MSGKIKPEASVDYSFALAKNGKVRKLKTSFIHTDHLNTPRIATNNKGEIVWRWEADAFGKSLTRGKRGIENDPDGDGKKPESAYGSRGNTPTLKATYTIITTETMTRTLAVIFNLTPSAY